MDFFFVFVRVRLVVAVVFVVLHIRIFVRHL
jgi:hypothetical protein